MKSMEQLLSNIPRLKYLELHANGDADLVNGQRWQMLTNRLITFNFSFSVSNNLGSNDLDTFRSDFWLKEKRWYVACVNRSLFSVPYFAETSADEEYEPITFSTLPNSEVLNNCITQLTLSEPVTNLTERFPQVDTLALFHTIDLSYISSIIDINRIQSLVLCSQKNYSGIGLLVNEMPNLCRISIKNGVKSFLEEIESNTFCKIRNLDVGNRYTINDDYEDDYNLERLCYIFPQIERLHIDHWCSVVRVLGLIRKFDKLSNVSFHISNWFVDEEGQQKNITEVKSILDLHRTKQNNDFTYRFDRSCVHLWL